MTLPDLTSNLPTWAPTALAITAAVAIAVMAGYLTGNRTRTLTAPRRRDWGRTAEATLTLTAAAIATAGAFTGMLTVFRDHLGMPDVEAYTLAGFLELGMVTCGIRARRRVKDGQPAGIDGAAVWILAALSAGLASAAEDDPIGHATRLVIPLVAAGMWELYLTTDRRRAAADTGSVPAPARIAWRITPARIAVLCRLADPTTRGVGDVDRSRRLARLTRVRIHLAALEDTTRVPRWAAWLTARGTRRALADWRLQRHALGAVEHLRLGEDQGTAAAIQSTVASVMGLRDATAPGAMSGASPWGAPVPGPAQDHHETPGPLTHPAADRDEAGPAAPLPLARPHPTSDIDDLTAARAQQVIDTLVATGQRVNLANFGRAWRASWSIEQGRLRVIYGATKSSAKTRGVA